jgi:hypothetical protein
MPMRRDNSWIKREQKREEREDNRRMFSKWVKCVVCDYFRISVKDALLVGPICGQCRERVTKRGTATCRGTDWKITYQETSNAQPA